MKKLNSFLLAILALVVVGPFLVACEKDIDDGKEDIIIQDPQITMTTIKNYSIKYYLMTAVHINVAVLALIFKFWWL